MSDGECMSCGEVGNWCRCDEDKPEPARLIQVCDKCLQASCWQGIFLCDRSQNAGTVYKTVEELTKLNLEHPDYWKTDAELSRSE